MRPLVDSRPNLLELSLSLKSSVCIFVPVLFEVLLCDVTRWVVVEVVRTPFESVLAIKLYFDGLFVCAGVKSGEGLL